MQDAKCVVTAISVEKRRMTRPMMINVEFVHGMNIKRKELLTEIEFTAMKDNKKFKQSIFRAYMMGTIPAGTVKIRCETDRVKLRKYPKELVPAQGMLKLTFKYKKQRFLKCTVPITIMYIQEEMRLMPPPTPCFEQVIVKGTGVEMRKNYDIRWD